MNTPLWIARRYIFARRSLQFISVITMLSLTGIAVGVAAIICVSSIFNGFRELYQSTMIAFDPHLRVTASQGAYFRDPDALIAQVSSSSGVRAASAVLSGRAVISSRNTFQIVQLHAIAAENFTKVSGVQGSVIAGHFLSADQNGLPQIVIGADLAMNAQLLVGDTITLLSPSFIENALQTLVAPQGMRTVVQGIFYTNSKEYNTAFAYCNVTSGRELFGVDESQVSSIDIRLDNVESANDVADQLRLVIPPNLHIESWYDLHKELYAVMKFERYASFIILSVIVLVSVFNIFAMLTMTIVKKRVDIGLLQSLGAEPKFIQRIFLSEGLLIGSIGTICGLILGLGLCYLQIEFQLIRFDSQSFIVPAIPVTIAWTDVCAICLLTIVFSFVATLFPARKAARTAIASALRTE